MPDWIAEIRRQLADLQLAPAREAEIVEELAQHAEDRYRELRSGGVTQDEARCMTLAELGGHELLARELRGVERATAPEPLVPGAPGRGRFLADLGQDLRYGFRTLRKAPGFTVVVTLTLALGIAVNTAAFAIVHSVLLSPLPGPNADAIVLLSNLYPKAGAGDQITSSAADYYDRLRVLTSLEEQAMFQGLNQTLDVSGTPEQVPGMAVTPSFFNLIGIRPAHGRAFSLEEGEIGSARKVILSYALWQQLYGGDLSAIGRDLRLGGTPYAIVGVIPREFVFVRPEVRLWVPLTFTAQQKTEYHSNNWSHIGRLRPGATVAQAQAQVNSLNAANLGRFPAFKDLLINAGFHTRVEPLRQRLVRDVAGVLYLLWGGAVFVLLIVALNITNLTLARWNVRGREIGTRLALGAGRARLACQLAVEGVLLGGAGGVAGILLGAGLLRALAAIGLDRFPRAHEVRIDGAVILVALGLAIAAGLLVGLVPIASTFGVNLARMSREAGRTGTGGRRARRLRQGLVGSEIGLAFVLLAGAGLLLASYRNLMAVDPGFTSQGVVTASTSAPPSRYRGGGDLRVLMNRALYSIRRLPGVAAAGATTAIPFGDNRSDSVILAEGYVMKPGESVISPRRVAVTPGYFETMKIALLRGRYFDDRDSENAPPVVIIDEQLARRFWPDSDPIGRRMYRYNPNDPNADANRLWYQVAGVVRSVRLEDLAGTRTTFGAYYFPYAQDTSRSYTLAVRAAGDAGAATRAVRSALARIDPELALFDVKTMSERAALSLASRRTSLVLAAALGGLALFLSAIGIYGVLSYLVSQRRREIAIRVALGSTGVRVVELVLREGLVLVAIGAAAGLTGAAGLQKVIASQVYGVRPLDPLVIGGVAVLLAAIALAASALPARRATRVDPVALLAEQ